MLRTVITAIAIVQIATAVAAQSPLSAIDWLTDSLDSPPDFEITPDSVPLVVPFAHDIFIKSGLAPVSPDAIGILAPSVTGFSANLWGDMPAEEIAALLRTYPNKGTPEARSLFHRILLAQANPAPNDTQTGLVLRARAERLLEIGALDAAEALIALAPVSNPEIFKLKFDIGILTDRTTAICKTLKSNPAISNDLSARVFCLARSGDWNAAAITLSLGGGIGAIEPAREELLIRFLDPVLFEGQPSPPAPDPLEIMDFVLREAVLLPRPSGLMPLSYIYRDIGYRAPLRSKIEASERLVMAGSLPENLLFSAYREGKAASSGGVWGRANSVQTLDIALASKDPAQISVAISDTYDSLANAGLLDAMAKEYANALVELEYSVDYAEVRNKVLDLLHLANISNATWADNAILDQDRQLALAIVTRAPLIADPASSAINRAIVSGFTDPAPESATATQILDFLEVDQQGQAILSALKLLSNGSLADPEGLRTGLYVLVAAGQSAVARRIAVQILLLPNGD